MAALTYEMITLHLRNPFRLSYGVSDTRQAYWIRLRDDEGWGEGTIPPYYHVDSSEMTSFWEQAAAKTRPYPDDPAGIAEWIGSGGPAPARCAVELALYDRIARRRGLPLYQLLGLPKPRQRATSFTIAIDTPEAMAQMALQIRDYPIIKVKLGSDDDEARLAAIRAARPDARLRVDANAGWTRDEAMSTVRELEKFDLEMIEQPLVKNDIEGMGLIQSITSIPIVADESVQTLDDVERLGKAGVQGINLKLMKVGGLTPALKIARRANELGMSIMLGCMIETSIGTTAMAHLSGLAEWFDLDAPILITNDPFAGIQYDSHANFVVPDRPGIGVVRADQAVNE
jgi:L-alanine-DL-glutamate epimerase-like enolase superfamily enzyme